MEDIEAFISVVSSRSRGGRQKSHRQGSGIPGMSPLAKSQDIQVSLAGSWVQATLA